MTQGAVIRSQRSAARKVSVRQRPCGTLATSRVPRAQRPWRGGVFVLGPGPVAAGHVGLGPSLVEEDQAARIKPALMGLPPDPAAGDVGAILLAGVHRFF